MRKFIFFVVYFLATLAAFSQESQRPIDLPPVSLIYDGMAGIINRLGISNPEVQRWNLSGNNYEIIVTHYSWKKGALIGRNTMFKIACEGLKKKKHIQTSIKGLPEPNIRIDENIDEANPVESYSSAYVFANSGDTGFYNITMFPIFEKDTVFEKRLINSIFFDGFYDTIALSKGKNAIEFSDRVIIFDVAIRHQAPRNIFIPSCETQFSWTEHKSQAEAERMKDYLQKKNQSPPGAKLITTDTITILIENVPTIGICTHFIVKDNFVKGKKKERELCVNYVVLPLRGKFVCCLISYYKEGSLHAQIPIALSPVARTL